MAEAKPNKKRKRVLTAADKLKQHDYYLKHKLKVAAKKREYQRRKDKILLEAGPAPLRELTPGVKYFYSLIKAAVSAKRSCLRCGIIFVSKSTGNRTCGSCAAQNAKQSPRSQESFLF